MSDSPLRALAEAAKAAHVRSLQTTTFTKEWASARQAYLDARADLMLLIDEDTILDLLADRERGAAALAKAQREAWLAAKREDCPAFTHNGKCDSCEGIARKRYPEPAP